LKEDAVPLKVTEVAPPKFAPEITTLVPDAPLEGLKPLTEGGGAVTVKLATLAAVPPGVVTAIGPEAAPEGTAAVIWVPESTVNVDAVPLNVTEVAPPKLPPEIVTPAPAAPLVGLKPATVGGPAPLVTVKEPGWNENDELVVLPAGVETPIDPDSAPTGTVATRRVGETTVNVAPAPPKVTLVAPVKLPPSRETVVPGGPDDGKKSEIDGLVTLKLVELVAVPAAAVTEMGPLVAFAGTTTSICELDTTVKAADRSLRMIFEAPLKFAPVSETVLPAGPAAGLTPVTEIEVTPNAIALVPVPPGAVTLIFPVVAPDGTTAVICVGESTVKLAALPLNLTAVAPVNDFPATVTEAPARPVRGEKPVTNGTTEKVPSVAVPDPVVTVSVPVAAPEGTCALIWLLDSTTKEALTPLNATALAPVRLVP